MTAQEHHELCLGLLATCWAQGSVTRKRAIEEAVEAAQQCLGWNVSVARMRKGESLVPHGQPLRTRDN